MRLRACVKVKTKWRAQKVPNATANAPRNELKQANQAREKNIAKAKKESPTADPIHRKHQVIHVGTERGGGVTKEVWFAERHDHTSELVGFFVQQTTKLLLPRYM